MTQGSVIGAGIAAFVALCWFCVSTHFATIRERLSAHDSVAVASVPPAQDFAGRLIADVRDDRVVLAGRVTPGLHDRLVARARELFGAGAVDDRLEVVPDAAAPHWGDPAIALIGLLRGKSAASHLEVDDRTVQVGGEVTGADIQARLLDEAHAMAGDLQIQDRMHVVVKAVPVDRLAIAQREVDALLTGQTIEFKRRSSEITDSAAVILDRIVRILAEEPRIKIRVEGHTDARGDASYNFRLSRKRATAVRDYLIAHGIGAERVTAEGFGSTRPLVDESDPNAARVNRRIEFRLDGDS